MFNCETAAAAQLDSKLPPIAENDNLEKEARTVSTDRNILVPYRTYEDDAFLSILNFVFTTVQVNDLQEEFAAYKRKMERENKEKQIEIDRLLRIINNYEMPGNLLVDFNQFSSCTRTNTTTHLP